MSADEEPETLPDRIWTDGNVVCFDGEQEEGETEYVRADALAAKDEEIARLQAFHAAWVESEVALATGNADLARETRRRLIDAHHRVRAALGEQL